MSETEKNKYVCWMFGFGLEAQDGRLIGPEVPEALLMAIIEWVEAHGLQIGGGFQPPTPEEARRLPQLELVRNDDDDDDLDDDR